MSGRRFLWAQSHGKLRGDCAMRPGQHEADDQVVSGMGAEGDPEATQHE